jgi:hypothetical protein
MTWGMVAVAGASLVGGIYSSKKAGDAAEDAANIQSESAQAGIAEQRRQFDAVRELLNPYVQAGTGALTAQQNLAGLGGAAAQQSAIDALMQSPQFTSAQQLGENRILANASATGGLRGGNTQSALAQFNPALLASTINDQYARLGNLTSLGQSSAAGVGNAGMATGNNVSNLLQQQGAAQAGGALAQGKEQAGYANAITSAIGSYFGMGGLGGGGGGVSSVGAGGSTYGLTGMGALFSDARLKTGVRQVGIGANGLPLYRFRYVWGGPEQLGHMAHEVAAAFPDAVSTHESGFLMVDYARV